jgi:hypothetical protein
MQKKIVFISIIFFLSPILLSHALVMLDLSNALAMRSTSSGSSSVRSNSSTPRIFKSSSTVKYFDGKTLLLENKKKYSLAGVKVLDLTQSRRNKAKSLNIKVAEMTFIDGRLTEAVISLR